MNVISAILGVILVVGGPCAVAVWIATHVRWPVAAFFLAWALTPLVMVAAVLVLAPFTPAGNDGTWAIVLPIYGIGTGLISAIVAGVIVGQRRARAMAPLPDARGAAASNETTSSGAEIP